MSAMKILKLSFLLCMFCSFILSCKKEKSQPETWRFTKLVNVILDNNGYMITLDFYQKKGNQWRILQFEPDDFTKFNFKDSITPNNYELPIDNENAYLTSNTRLFNPATNQIHFPYKIKWLSGAPVQFNSTKTFATDFPDMPTTGNAISKFSAATYSLEQAYDMNPKTNTYIFYDFPNQKYLYYAERTGTDLILENTLPLLCTTCNLISWKDIDAVTCTGDTKNNDDIYYFFDFDTQKMFILFREGKNTNNPHFRFDKVSVYDFKEAFKGKYPSPESDHPFDFSK
jgi:hypothetical protein